MSSSPLTGNAMQAVANVEAEQAVLGVLMMYPAEAWEEVGELPPAAFFEPVHGRLMEAMIEARAAGRSAEPTLLAPSFRADPALQALGGLRYLLDLVDRAPPVCSAAEFGRGVRDAALRRSLLETAGEVIDRVRIDHKSDAAALAIDAERAFTTLASAGSTGDVWQTGGGVVRDAIAQAQARGGAIQFPTGLADVDALTGGFTAGEVAVIAGRPGMAKSTVGLAIAKANASQGLGVPVFSLEMGVGPLGLRVACDVAYERSLEAYSYGGGQAVNPTYDRARKNLLTADQWSRLQDAADVVDAWPLKFDTRPGLTVSQIEAGARRAFRDWERQGVKRGPVVVDHLGIIKPETERSGNKVAETGDVSRGLAEMAKRLEVPVVALCQVNRSNEKLEDKRPSLSDLRWSGAIEEDARQVIFLYRPEYYLRAPEGQEDFEAAAEREAKLQRVRQKLFWIVAKNNNGELGQVETFCDVGCSAVRDRVENW